MTAHRRAVCQLFLGDGHLEGIRGSAEKRDSEQARHVCYRWVYLSSNKLGSNAAGLLQYIKPEIAHSGFAFCEARLNLRLWRSSGA
jgi:hypothetical protein